MNKAKQRQCQACTACCEGWVRMLIDNVAVYPGHPCPHRCERGCDNYTGRPVEPCRNFICGWLQHASPLPETFRPDKAGVIVLPAARRWRDLPVDIAVPVGRAIPATSLQWLKEFAMQQMRPLIYLQQDRGAEVYQLEQDMVAYGPPEFQSETRQLLASGQKLW